MSLVKDVVRDELVRAIELIAKYESKKASAKTEYKKQYYTKKLKVQNEIVGNMLQGFNRLQQKQALEAPTREATDSYPI